MKQPELGYKITELRKSKGLTQEELVEICNVSVRTIQRIEAGEVTPRSYTIKTILAALDYDLSKIQAEESPIAEEFKKLFLLNVDDRNKANFLRKQLQVAWISGIVYFIIGFAEFSLDYSRYVQDIMLVTVPIYILLKVGTLFSMVFFYRGFILAGKLFTNYLMRITSFIIVFIAILFYSYDIVSLFLGGIDFELVAGAEAITFGIVGILFGISVIRLKKGMGTIAMVTGIFEIITYGFMVTIVLSLVALILLTPTIILEIILLYKVSQMLIAKQKELDRT